MAVFNRTIPTSIGLYFLHPFDAVFLSVELLDHLISFDDIWCLLWEWGGGLLATAQNVEMGYAQDGVNQLVT